MASLTANALLGLIFDILNIVLNLVMMGQIMWQSRNIRRRDPRIVGRMSGPLFPALIQIFRHRARVMVTVVEK